MHYDNRHREEHTVLPKAGYLTFRIDYVLFFTGIPDCPNDDSKNDRVEVEKENYSHEAFAVYEFASESK